MLNRATLFRWLPSTIIAVNLLLVAPAPAKQFPEGMYFFVVGDKPGVVGIHTYAICPSQEAMHFPPGVEIKKYGPFDSEEGLRAHSDEFRGVVGTVQVRVYDASGKWLPDFQTLVDPSPPESTPNATPATPAAPAKPTNPNVADFGLKPLSGGSGTSSSAPHPPAPQTSGGGSNSAGTSTPHDRFAIPEEKEAPFTIVELTGSIVILRGTKEIKLTEGQKDLQNFKFHWDDQIDVNANSRVRIKTPDGDILTLDEYTDQIRLGRMTGGGVDVKQKSGSVQIESAPGRPKRDFEGLEVHTPVAGAAPDGTKWRSQYDRNKQAHRFDVYEGKVRVTPTNPNLKPRLLSAGQWCIVYPDHIEPPDAGQEIDDSALRGLAMETRTVHSGTQLTMPVLLKGIPPNTPGGLANMNFEVSYDPSVVKVTGTVARGNIYGGHMLFEANARESGRIRIGFAGSSGFSAIGTVAQVPFQVIGRPGQQTALTLKVLQCQTPQGRAVSLATTHGKIIIPAPAPPPQSSTSGAGGEHLAPSSHGGGPGGAMTAGHVSPTGQVTPTEYLGPSNHLPPNFHNPDGTLRGDMGGTGKLKAFCSEGALQMSVGNRPVDMNLDVDRDGQVMSADARLILQGAADTMQSTPGG